MSDFEQPWEYLDEKSTAQVQAMAWTVTTLKFIEVWIKHWTITMVAVFKAEFCLFPNSFEVGKLTWSWILSYHD